MNKLLFGDIEVSQKDFKKTIPLSLVDLNNIVVSNKVKGNNETSKYFIGYLNDVDIVVPLCIILPRMSGYIKYFENGGKNMSFKIEDELLSVKFYSEPIYDDKYIKLKEKHLVVRLIHCLVETKFQKKELNMLVLHAFLLIQY